MEQLIMRIKKNKKMWLTSGVALLLVVVLVVGQLLVRYEKRMDIVSQADNEETTGEEEYQFEERYEELVAYDCPVDENVIATMTYTALVTLKEEEETEDVSEEGTEDNSSVSDNNIPEENPTESDNNTPETPDDASGTSGSESGDNAPGTSGPESGDNTSGTSSPESGDNSSGTPGSESGENSSTTPETTPSGQSEDTPETPSGDTPSGENLQGRISNSSNVVGMDNSVIQFLSDTGTGGESGAGGDGGTGTGGESGAGGDGGTGTDGESGAGGDDGTGNDGESGTGGNDGTGTGTGDETPEETWPKEIEVTLHFTDLNAAITAAQALYEIKNAPQEAEEGQQEQSEEERELFIPRIVLVADVMLNDSLVCTNPYTFELDFNGHLITLGENAKWDVQTEGTIVLLDSIEEGEHGGLFTEGESIFSGLGHLVFENGYYLAGNGSIIQSASSAVVKDGIFLFDRHKKFFAEGETKLPVGKVFYPSTMFFRGNEIACLILDDPDYMVLFGEQNAEESGEEGVVNTYLFATFEEAWEEAQKLSEERENETARICIFDDQILRIAVKEPLVQTKGKLEISNLRFIREDGYRDSFFEIEAGELTLTGVGLDGTVYSEDIFVASDALVKVEAGTLHLRGTQNFPLVVEKNTVSHVRISAENTETIEPNEDEVIPDVEIAGILVGNRGKVTLEGRVCIKDNWVVTEITEDNPKGLVQSNLTLSPQSELWIDGKLAEESRIGISYTEDVIAGLTLLGKIGNDYLEAFLLEGAEIEQLAEEENTEEELVRNGDERLLIFELDAPEYRAYYAMYDEERNEIYWDKDQILLPEAGILRIEYLLFAVAAYLMLLTLLIKLIKKEPTNKTLLIVSVSCLAFSVIFGTYRIVHEKNMARKNQQVMEEIIAMYDNPQEIQLSLGTANVNSVETRETIDEVIEESKPSKPTVSVPQDGRDYIGIIEISELKIKLPVLAEYSGANMKTTPCVYYGEVGEPNLVIVGHNYDTQFGTLNTIGEEEEIHVKLTLLDGTSYEYVSVKREELNPDDVDKMLSSTWDLTIFTCNYVGDKRVTFRCELEQ